MTTEITSQQISQDLILLLDKVKSSAQTLAETRGLTRMQLLALSSIGMHTEVAMRQVASVLHCDASNVTGIVDRLVAQGLVLREESPQDRRVKTLRLTAKGQDIVDSIKAELPTALGCERLDSAERTALHGIIQKLVAS